jgi:ABC-type branched-subunit amino acid transport system substrate-binding protein
VRPRSTIKPLPGIQYVVQILDAFVTRRSRLRAFVVVITGVAGSVAPGELIANYRQRLVSDASGRALVPHAFVAGGETPGDPADAADIGMDLKLFGDMVNELKDTMPDGAGQLRLPTYLTCRAVLDASVELADQDVRRRKLRDLLFAEHADRTPWLGWLVDLGKAEADSRLGGALKAMVAPLVQNLPRWLYGVRLRKSGQFRWFNVQLTRAGVPSRDFLSGALRLARNGENRGDTAIIRRVLLIALLQDLRRAQRRPRLTAWRRRRRWPFVLLFESIDEGNAPARRFVDAFATLVRDQDSAIVRAEPSTRPAVSPLAVRKTPLLLLAGVAGQAPPYAESAGTDHPSLEEAARALQLTLQGRGSVGPFGHIAIPDEPDRHDRLADEWLRVNQKVSTRRNRLADWVPAILTATTAVAVAAVGAVTVMSGTPAATDAACPQMHPSSKSPHELVGITDGSCRLGDEVWPVEQSILRENQRIAGHPYRTVVFFAPLTLPPEAEHFGLSSLPQLRGALVAQIRANREAEVDSDKLRVRLLIANPADRFVDGPAVASQIARLARVDRTYAAVIGISQSRAESREAIRLLVDTKMPVVGAVLTGDNMTDSSPYAFQITPRNKRIAAVMAEFARYGRPVEGAAGQLADAGMAIIVRDPADYYSSNLASDFAASFRGRILDTVDYQAGNRTTSADEVVSRICRAIRSNAGTFVYYAGRAQQFSGLLNAVRGKPECVDVAITVLAGVAIAVFMADPATNIAGYPFLHLYWAAFSNPEGRPADRARPDEVEMFGREFGAEFRSTARPDGNAAAGFDSLLTAAHAINAAYAQGHDLQFDPSVASTKLRDGLVSFVGATGYIRFDGTHRYVPAKPVLIVRTGQGSESTVIMTCGTFSPNDRYTNWGQRDRYVCPADN